MKLTQIDDQMIEELKKSQRDVIRRYHFQDMMIEHQAMINKIYKRQQGNISGADAREFDLAVRVMNKDTHEMAFKMLGDYRGKMEKLTLDRLKYELPGT